MKTKLMVLALLAGSSLFAETRVSVGIGFGGGYAAGGYYPAPPPPAYAYEAPCPGPGYYWVPGSWFRIGPRWSWRTGYWAPPRFGGGYYRHFDDHRYDDRGYRGRGWDRRHDSDYDRHDGGGWGNGYRRH